MSNRFLDFKSAEIDNLRADFARDGATTVSRRIILLMSKPQVRVVFFYRLGRAFHGARGLSVVFFYLFKMLHRWACAALNCEVPLACSIGPGFKIYHGYCLVINADARIGANFTVQHSVTVGSTRKGTPVIADNVEVGTQVAIIGGIRIGSNSVIGAGTVVVKDVESNSVVVGNPQRVVRVQHALQGERVLPSSEA